MIPSPCLTRIALLICVSLISWSSPTAIAQEPSPAFDGTRAFQHLRALVEIGVRSPGTPGALRAQEYIKNELRGLKLEPTEQVFTAETPLGPKQMTNIIATIPGQTKNIIVVAAHYDTKYFEGIKFVGANDGASGPAVLLELAQWLQPGALKSEIWLVFFDGEEAFVKWSDNDCLYGSRYFVRRLQEENRLGMVKAMLLLDMVADSDLRLESEMKSTRRLREIVWEQARRLGYEEHFSGGAAWIDDDHIPFLKKGIPALCIIDFHYGPGSRSNEFWHTPHDTLDKVSPESLQIVGEVVIASLPEITAFVTSGR